MSAEQAPDPTEGVDPRITTGSVYRPPELERFKLLVMRRWPRGIAKTRVDEWAQQLGPSAELLDGYRQGEGEIAWPEFESRYLDEVGEREELLAHATELAAEGGLMLLCGSHWPCHRLPLAQLITKRLEAG